MTSGTVELEFNEHWSQSTVTIGQNAKKQCSNNRGEEDHHINKASLEPVLQPQG